MAGAGDRLHAGAVEDFLTRDERVVLHSGEHEILVLAAAGRIFAVGNRCTHMPMQLRQGIVNHDSGELFCNVHMGGFSLATGAATTLPCELPLPVYRVEIDDADVYVRVPSAPAPRTAPHRDVT